MNPSPKVLQPAIEQQKLRWRSGILEIIAETCTPERTRQVAVGTGILVSRDDLVVERREADAIQASDLLELLVPMLPQLRTAARSIRTM